MDLLDEIGVRTLGHAALVQSKNMGAIVAPRQASGGIPLEGYHLPGCHRVRQTDFTLLFSQEGQFKRRFIASPLSEQRNQHESAKRHQRYSDLGTLHAFGERDSRIAK